MTLDTGSPISVVSERFASTILHASIQDEEHPMVGLGTLRYKTLGYTELNWVLNSNKDDVHVTRFYVISDDEHPFDLILSGQAIQGLNFLPTQKKQHMEDNPQISSK